MPSAAVTVDLNKPRAVISPNLYGHFIEHLGGCITGGIWVGEDSPVPNVGGVRRDFIELLRKIRPPVLRWPGGCFADDYHWRDGVGPPNHRPRTVNLWWGQNVETNAFGTHEFISLCRAVGAQPYLAGNVGSGSPRELRDWVEYCNFPADSTLANLRRDNGSPQPFGVRLWGVGNENWGCGGHFCPEDYAAEYKRFATYLPDLGGTPNFLIACGPDGNNIDWTRRFFTRLGSFRRIHGFAAHYYCGTAGAATQYTPDQWYELLYKATLMERLILQQHAAMSEFDPDHQIGLIVDEWGTWHPPAPGRNPKHLWQQNTMRDALVAAITLDIFNRHADKIIMANLAQTANVLQALFLTDGEKLIATPTYHVFDMYKPHQGGQGITMDIQADQQHQLPGLMGSASIQGETLTLSLVNPSASNPVEAAIELLGAQAKEVRITELFHPDIHAHNTFDSPGMVKPNTTAARPGNEPWRHTLPPASITVWRTKLE